MIRIVTGNFIAGSLAARLFGRGKPRCATVSPPEVSHSVLRIQSHRVKCRRGESRHTSLSPQRNSCAARLPAAKLLAVKLSSGDISYNLSEYLKRNRNTLNKF